MSPPLSTTALALLAQAAQQLWPQENVSSIDHGVVFRGLDHSIGQVGTQTGASAAALRTALPRPSLDLGTTPGDPDTALSPASPPSPTQSQSQFTMEASTPGPRWRVLMGSSHQAQGREGVTHSDVGRAAELGFEPSASPRC